MQRTVRNSDDLKAVVYDLGNMRHPFRVTLLKGAEDRTSAQNRTVHKWFGELAAHFGDRTAEEIKADCNIKYGRPILMRDDPEWSAVFGYLFDALDYERKRKAVRILDVPFTRRMTVAQLSEYMDQMQRDYLSEGVRLTDPERQTA